MFWILLGIISFLLIQCSSGQAGQCASMIVKFNLRSGSVEVPQFCVALDNRFTDTHGAQYRIDFTESEVESVCNSTVCKDFIESIPLSCITFAKKDLNCLDTPGLIHVWCGNSDQHNNTNCFTSLINQGVISTPSMLTPCLDAIYNAENCPAYCRDLLANADCCFASYYAFMIDAYLDNSGRYPVFENQTSFLEELWEWCDLPTPTICPDLSLVDYSPRLNNATCDVIPPTLPTNTTGNGGTDNDGTDNGGTDNDGTDNGGTDNDGTDNGGINNSGSDCDNTDCDGTDYGRGGTTIHHPIVDSFYILMIFTLLLVIAID